MGSSQKSWCLWSIAPGVTGAVSWIWVETAQGGGLKRGLVPGRWVTFLPGQKLRRERSCRVLDCGVGKCWNPPFAPSARHACAQLHRLRHLCWPHGQWDWVHPQQVCWWHQAEWCGRHARGKGCHPEGPWQAWEVGLWEPHEVQQGQVRGPSPGSGQSQAQIQAGRKIDSRAALRRRTWGCWLMRSSMWSGNVCLQAWKPTISWAASREAWPAGRGRWFCPSTQFWWNPTMYVAIGQGVMSLN